MTDVEVKSTKVVPFIYSTERTVQVWKTGTYHFIYPIIRDSTDDLKAWALKVKEFVEEVYKEDRINFVGIGTSGAMMLLAIKYELGNGPLINKSMHKYSYTILKKPTELTHRNTMVPTRGKYIFVDDLIGRGGTLQTVVDILAKEGGEDHSGNPEQQFVFDAIAVPGMSFDTQRLERAIEIAPTIKYILT